MLLKHIFEDQNFVAGTQTSSYLDLILKCLMNSSRAITKYLETPPEQHQRLRQSVVTTLKSGDQFALSDMHDIVDALKDDGHIVSLSDVRNVKNFFATVDAVIRGKRNQDS